MVVTSKPHQAQQLKQPTTLVKTMILPDFSPDYLHNTLSMPCPGCFARANSTVHEPVQDQQANPHSRNSQHKQQAAGGILP
jgi:hypothetical protein